MGYGRSYDIGVFGSIFGHAVTQICPCWQFKTTTPLLNSTTFSVSRQALRRRRFLPYRPMAFCRCLTHLRPVSSEPNAVAKTGRVQPEVQHQLSNTLSAELAS